MCAGAAQRHSVRADAEDMAIEQSTAVERHHGISLDALILVLISGLRLHLNSFKETTFTTPALNAITVGLLGLYLALDILGRPLLAGAARSRRAMYAAKSAVLAAIIVLTVIWPTLNMIGLRHASQPWNDVHDTSINVEEATKFLLNGKDPYAQTYFKTPLAQFTWHSEPKYGYGLNPALWQTDIFPAQALLTVPFMLAAQDTVGWFDERFIYLLAFALAVVLAAAGAGSGGGPESALGAEFYLGRERYPGPGRVARGPLVLDHQSLARRAARPGPGLRDQADRAHLRASLPVVAGPAPGPVVAAAPPGAVAPAALAGHPVCPDGRPVRRVGLEGLLRRELRLHRRDGAA